MKVDYNGTIHEFPDDFTDADVQAALASEPDSPDLSSMSLDQLSQINTGSPDTPQPIKPGFSLKESMLMAPDALATLGAGAVMTPLAGLAGLASMPFVGGERASEITKSVQGAAYQPRTEAAKGALGLIAKPFEALAEGGDYLGQKAADATGSPAIGAGVNTAVQAAPMAVLGTVAPAIRGGLQASRATGAARAGANVGVDAARANVRDAGYIVTPTEASNTPIRGMTETVIGRGQLKHSAIVRNQETTNRLAREDLGLQPDAPLTDGTLAQVRQQAGQAYDAVSQVRQPFLTNPRYRGAVANLGNHLSAATRRFPALTNNPQIAELRTALDGTPGATFMPDELVGVVRQLRRDSTANLRRADNPESSALGRAQRDAADAVDDLIQDNLQQRFGAGQLYDNYVNARRTIAKAHDYEAALNEPTGNINAGHFATQMRRGRPLSGPSQTIAEFGNSFPRLSGLPERTAPPPVSIGDAITGGVAGAFTGGKGLLAMAARPAARALTRTDMVQNRLMQPNYAPTLENTRAAIGNPLTAPLVGNEQAKRSLLAQLLEGK